MQEVTQIYKGKYLVNDMERLFIIIDNDFRNAVAKVGRSNYWSSIVFVWILRPF